MLFTEAKTDRTAGHEWRETGKNLIVRVRIEILYGSRFKPMQGF